ncbi:MAG: hypothetical protein WD896_00485, partial [Parcubacteria group bacterium]
MRNALIALGFTVATLASGAWIVLYLPPTVGSPVQIYPAYIGPGTGHGFGYGIEYTVVGHASHDGRLHAVITSGAPGEGYVQIWSPIPDLVVLSPGTKFRLARAESFSRALQVGGA